MYILNLYTVIYDNLCETLFIKKKWKVYFKMKFNYKSNSRTKQNTRTTTTTKHTGR